MLSSFGMKAIEVTSPCTVVPVAVEQRWIQNPILDGDEGDAEWVCNREWVFTQEFTPTPEILNQKTIELVFEGLDTHVDIQLNAAPVFHSENMFYPLRVDVKPILREGKNVLTLTFHPAREKDSIAASQYPITLPDSRAFSRKAPYSYGWDWGPNIPDMGIWKPVYLRAYTNSIIESAWVNTVSISNDTALCDLWFVISNDSLGGGSLELYDSSGSIIDHFNLYDSDFEDVPVNYPFWIPHPRLWNSNGSGSQYQYEYQLILKNDGGRIIDRKKLKFGVRTVELDTSADAQGNRFAFIINGKPCFMKGANYVPSTSFPAKEGTKHLRSLLISAAEANFNMIRVWGGGYYEDDLFYDLCDSLGLMVWQDFMFACALYPDNPEFNLNIVFESWFQTSRLASHPCIVLWCGNNEVKNGWEDWGWQSQYNWTPQERETIQKGYDAIFHSVLPTSVNLFSPQIPYWPSSPLWGWGHPEHLKEGDSHHWGVWWGEQPISTFSKDIPRFMSEYGMQAYPCLAALAMMNTEDPLDIFSPNTQNHQKHPRGHQLINYYLMQEFGLIPNDPLEYIYLTQLLQAKTLETAIVAQRSAEPYCMGTLYWQLNDCWPSISWSSIDYTGSWKASHYFVKRLYSDDWEKFKMSSLSLNVNSDAPVAAKVRLSVIGKGEDGALRYLLRSEGHALCVGLMASHAGHFDDNFFDMNAGESRILRWIPSTPGDDPGEVHIITLNDILSK